MSKTTIMFATIASLIGVGACADQDPGTAARTVHEAYDKLADLTQTTHPVRVQTEITTTGVVADIADRRYFDLVTYQPGEQTRLETEVHRIAGQDTAAYTVHWTGGAPDTGAPPDLTLRQVWEMAQGTPSSTNANAVPLDNAATYARYHVVLQLDGQLRMYDALAIVDGGEPIILDPMLWMMNRVWREPLPATAPASDDVAYAAGSNGGGGGSGNCAVTEWVNPNAIVDSKSGTDWHTSGNHRAFSSSNYKCNCDASCVSTCTPLGSSSASDTGVFIPQPGLGWWHASDSSRNDIPGTGQPGAGSTCDSAGGALVRNCLFGVFCDLHVGFEVGGAGIVVVLPAGIWPSSIWVSAKTSLRGTCAACQPAAPAPDPLPDVTAE